MERTFLFRAGGVSLMGSLNFQTIEIIVLVFKIVVPTLLRLPVFWLGG